MIVARCKVFECYFHSYNVKMRREWKSSYVEQLPKLSNKVLNISHFFQRSVTFYSIPYSAAELEIILYLKKGTEISPKLSSTN